MAEAPSAWGQSDDYRRSVDATAKARLEHFRAYGQPDQQAWFPTVIPPRSPVWPTGPAWRRIRAGKQTIVSSDGLSDPSTDFDRVNLGFGVEVALATNDEIPEKLHPSWLLDLAMDLSNQAAKDGAFYARAAKFGVFLFGTPAPPESYREWLDPSGMLGYLLGVPVPGVDPIMQLPAGNAVLLMAKVLTPKEYEFVAGRGLEGAHHLVELFARNGTHHLSSLNRTSVV